MTNIESENGEVMVQRSRGKDKVKVRNQRSLSTKAGPNLGKPLHNPIIQIENAERLEEDTEGRKMRLGVS